MKSSPLPPLLCAHPECPAWQVHLFGLTLGLVTGADFVAVGMMGVASDTIRGGIGATPQEFLWSLTTFAVGAIVVNLLLGKVANRISYRRYTLLALLVFMAGSLASALADSINQLAAARLLQGLGGGGLFTASRILLQIVAAPKERKPLLRGFLAGCFGLSALSPWLSALVVRSWGWQAIFVLQAAYAPALMALVWLSYPRHAGAASRQSVGELDWLSVVALGGGALLILHVLEDVRLLRFAAEPDLALWLLAGIVLVALAVWRIFNHADPWLDLGKLTGRRYLTGLGFYGVYYVFNGMWTTQVASLLQKGLGFDSITSGGLLSVGAAITVVTALLYLSIAQYFRQRRHQLLAMGFALLLLSCLMLAHAAMPGAALESLVPAIALHGLVPVLGVMQIAALTYQDLTVEDFAHAYQLKNILRELAGALGTGIAVLQWQGEAAQANSYLVERMDAAHLLDAGLQADEATLMRLAADVSQQAALIASDHVLISLAVGAGICMLLALRQRTLV